ncbi:hypothetical protein ACI48J_03330 [Paenibacillus chitinolyticus]|uniref:hypothetical protein n=1 Tax=Paenibacillus chitinolyticus TaxID=79263 RepID=UPI0038662329
MNKTRSKLMVSTLAAALLLGGGAALSSQVFAADSTDSGQTSTQQSAPFKHDGKDRKSFGQFGGPGSYLKDAATVLGLEEKALITELKAGKSLVQLAEAKGISQADLVKKLVEASTKEIDAKVTEGKIDSTKAAELKANLQTRIEKAVTVTGMQNFKGGKHGREGGFVDPEKLAAILGITKDELKTQQEAGKTVAEIAEAKGFTREQLLEKLKTELTPSLEKFIDAKKGDKSQKKEQQQAQAEQAE